MKLKELRAHRGLTQAEVASVLNVEQAAVSRWESGETRIARKHHEALSRLYSVPVCELLSSVEETRAQSDDQGK